MDELFAYSPHKLARCTFTSITFTTAMATVLRRSSRLLTAVTVEVASATVAGPSRDSAKVISSGSRPRVKRPRSVPDDSKLSSEEDITPQPIKKRAKMSAKVASATSEESTEAKKPNRTKKDNRAIEYSVSDFPQRSSSLWKIGPHVSAAGGVENAILNAASIGYVLDPRGVQLILTRVQRRATAFALFLKSQRKWDSPPLTEKSIEAFKARLKTFEYDVKHILPHGNYLVNLGNPDP